MITRTSRWLALSLSLIAFAACGGESESGNESAPDDTAPATTPTSGADTSSGDAEQASASGGILRVSYYVAPSRFDPHKATSSFDNTALFLTYDRLVHLAPDATPVAGLAESWEFADDGSYLDLQLRTDVTFHDGAAFDADAVKANIERGQTLEDSSVSSELGVIDSVEVVDEFTVRLHLNGPAASLPLILADRAGAMVSPDAFDNPDLTSQPVGAGMYTVTEYQEGAYIEYAAYDDYWDADAQQLDGVEFTVQSDSATRLNAIRSGQADWTFVDPQQVEQAEAAGINILPTLTLSSQHLQLNRSFEPFSDARVREAVNLAIDREAIAAGIYLGNAIPASQIFPPGYFAHNENIEPFTYDPDRARELLADAGYADGFTFSLITSDVAARRQVAEAVQAQLAEVGIELEITLVPGGKIADVFYAQEQHDAMWASWGGRHDPSQTLELLYSADAFANPGGHSTPEVEAAIDATLAVQPDEQRIETIRGAVQLVHDEALDVVVIFEEIAFLSTDRVTGVEGWFSAKPEFRGVGVTD